MPDFDGTGPRRRGRAIGRGLGPCKNATGCSTCQMEDAPEITRRDPTYRTGTGSQNESRLDGDLDKKTGTN
ncbi:MAG: hypothetical protein PHF57_06085 [Methanoregula sp.]|nr:hypothetical protein [Methanoregula sp.]MDD5025384.1 hypothetical protein [Methanoregula sp.]MDD5187759.1 hypothetical protein [Methanoregula sp.]